MHPGLKRLSEALDQMAVGSTAMFELNSDIRKYGTDCFTEAEARRLQSEENKLLASLARMELIRQKAEARQRKKGR